MITLAVNGRTHTLEIDPDTPLSGPPECPPHRDQILLRQWSLRRLYRLAGRQADPFLRYSG